MIAFFKSRFNVIVTIISTLILIGLIVTIKLQSDRIDALKIDIALKDVKIDQLEKENLIYEQLKLLEDNIYEGLQESIKENKVNYSNIRRDINNKLDVGSSLSDKEKSIILIDSIWDNYTEVK